MLEKIEELCEIIFIKNYSKNKKKSHRDHQWINDFEWIYNFWMTSRQHFRLKFNVRNSNMFNMSNKMLANVTDLFNQT